MKKCFKCNEVKELTEFYKHAQMLDGHLNKCKACNKKDTKENTAKNRDYYLAYDKKRANLPHRVKQRLEYSTSERGRLMGNKAKRNYTLRNPNKKIAARMVNNAIRDNRLQKLPCIHCGKKAQAHHPDYSKPLDVIWLCSKHHAEEHKRLRALGINL